VNGKWTKPKNIGSPINSPNWEPQPSIAPNADAIYFVRGGPRGTGDKDLYITRLQDNGTWATPEKIEELNTPYHESSPSIHPDGKTLYFSSKGHEGMGGYDLFISRLQENGKWGKPQNLGYPINTAAAEEALAVSWQGDVAYLASNRAGGFGSLDIYSFELPSNAKPAPITYIKGITKDAETNQPLSAYVEIIDLKTQKRFTKLTTKRDGEFTICLPTGEYALNARRPQYAFFSANYDLNEAAALTEAYQLIAPLQPIKEKQDNQPIVLENVFFETASAVLRDNSKAELDKLKAFLEENATIKIQLNGHTDNVGEEEDNLLLSDQRANAVRNYLIKNGIDSSRMTAKGFGESKPIQSNETTTGRSKNRRTEFQIMP
jgi:outer membrane protein OmpA-like peptidoglycan-associated protein